MKDLTRCIVANNFNTEVIKLFLQCQDLLSFATLCQHIEKIVTKNNLQDLLLHQDKFEMMPSLQDMARSEM
jgi:hypothetical protein